MRVSILLSLGLATLSARAAERDIVRTFPIHGPCAVKIDTYRGGILVEEGDSQEVRIAVHLEIGGDTEAEAEDMLHGLQLAWSSDDRNISVVARHPAETRARFVWNDKRQIEPTYRVTVPHNSDLDLRTINGAVRIGAVVGHIHAQVENGDLFLRQVGGVVETSTQNGELVVSHCVGSLKAQVLQGTLRVGTVTGACEITNKSGDVDVMALKAGGRIYAEAGFANVGLAHDFTGDLDVRTSGGGIGLNVEATTAATIDASVSWFAHIQSRLPLVLESGRPTSRHLIGRLNAGGARVHLHASGGDIILRPAATSLE